jgi:hypothetical protein
VRRIRGHPGQHLVDDRHPGRRGVPGDDRLVDVDDPALKRQLDQHSGGHGEVEADLRADRPTRLVVVREQQQLFGQRNRTHGQKR